MGKQREEDEIDLLELLEAIMRKLWLVIVCGLVLGIVMFAYTAFLMTPLYTSTTKVYILNKKDESQVTYSDTQLATQLTQDYVELIQSRNVLERVISENNLAMTYNQLQSNVSVKNPNGTRILYISVKNPDPYVAQHITNAVRDIAAERIKNVMDIEAVNVVDEANLPSTPSEPSKKRNTMLGTLIGMMLAIAIIVIQFLMDDSIKTSEDVEKYLGLSTLALIPVVQENEKNTKKRRDREKPEGSERSGKKEKPAKPVKEKAVQEPKTKAEKPRKEEQVATKPVTEHPKETISVKEVAPAEEERKAPVKETRAEKKASSKVPVNKHKKSVKPVQEIKTHVEPDADMTIEFLDFDDVADSKTTDDFLDDRNLED